VFALLPPLAAIAFAAAWQKKKISKRQCPRIFPTESPLFVFRSATWKTFFFWRIACRFGRDWVVGGCIVIWGQGGKKNLKSQRLQSQRLQVIEDYAQFTYTTY
jgi:hypothetical protein